MQKLPIMLLPIALSILIPAVQATRGLLELVPLDLHRVRWRPMTLDGPDMEIGDPRQVLDLALSGLPP